LARFFLSLLDKIEQIIQGYSWFVPRPNRGNRCINPFPQGTGERVPKQGKRGEEFLADENILVKLVGLSVERVVPLTVKRVGRAKLWVRRIAFDLD